MTDVEILKTMLLSRSFENKLSQKFKEGVFYGTTHLNIGQEASHVGLIAALDAKDWIVPTHRCHGFNIARGTDIEEMFSEMFGSRHGVCRGLGGSMHMSEVSTCNAGSSAIVGSGVPIATGIAFALKRKKQANIAVAIFGDGASSRGSVHEAMNIASVWNIPVLFYLENNHYGMSASEHNAISTDNIASRAKGYSIEYERVDGNDVMDEWRKKDPIKAYSDSLIERGVISEADYLSLCSSVDEEVDEAFKKADATKDDVLSLRELESFLFAPSPVSLNRKGALHKASYRDAIYEAEAIDEILREDASAFLMGEDIGLYGGCFGVSKDLYLKHPGKVLETPVSEEGFTALAVGASMLGLHPIVEIMYADFSTLASDPLINHAAKTYFMSAGQLNCPLVYRAPIGSGTGHGSQHTANIEAMFLNTPGLIVVAPSDAYSAKALLKSAHRDNNPVLFFEHKGLYDSVGDVGDENVYLPLGKAIVSSYGNDLLIIGYSHAFHTALEATRDIRDRITYVDLATISPLDKSEIIRQASSHDKILVVQDTPENGSVGDSVISIIAREVPGDKKIKLLSARSLPIPFSRNLEKSVIPTKEEIRKAAFELLDA